MSDFIEESKYVELIYKVVDKKTGNVFSNIEYPVGYVHGANELWRIKLDSQKIF